MMPDDTKDGKTETSSTGSLSERSADSSHKRKAWRVKRLIRALSFERGPSPLPPPPTTTVPSNESALTLPSFGGVGCAAENDNHTNHHHHHACKENVHGPIHVIPVLHGTVDPEGEVEVIFYDAHQDGDDSSQNFHGTFQRESIVLSHIKRGGGGGGSSNGTNPYYVEVDNDESNQGEGSSYPYHPATPEADAKRPAEVTVEDQTSLPPKVLPPPLPPKELPLRFLRAGKGDPVEGLRRYEQTLAWRKEERVDTILREANHKFDVIKQHYKHFCHGRGKNGEPCYYEQPPKTNLKALRAAGVDLDTLLRHYVQVAEFQWQFLERDDLCKSIYIIDVEGMRFGDFVGEVVDFVKRASKLSNLHYPERAGYGECVCLLCWTVARVWPLPKSDTVSLATVFVINVPSWFKLIWKYVKTSTKKCNDFGGPLTIVLCLLHSVVKQWIDPVTLEKISILRGKEEIRQNMESRIPAHHLPPEYGGQSVPLGQSQEELTLRALVVHNNAIAGGDYGCGGVSGNCRFCNFVPARAY